MLSFVLIFLILFITYLYFSKTSNKKDWDNILKIPGPPTYPIIGNLIELIFVNTGELFANERKRTLKYYPIYKMWSFNVKCVVLAGPEDIEKVLTNKKHNSKNEIYKFLRGWLGTGLLTSAGNKWQTRRKILTPAFHFSILHDFLNVFNEETKNLVEALSKLCDQPYIDVKIPITEFTIATIADTAMGINLNDRKNIEETNYKSAVHQIGELIIHRLNRPWLYNQFVYSLTRYKKEENSLIKVLHKFTNNVVATHKRDFQIHKKEVTESYSVKKKLAMLDILLTYQKEGADISDEGIREEVDTFMFEGHDTTSVALCFLLMVLANEPNHQEQVYQEIMDTLDDKIPDHNDLNQLTYMDLVIKECLRLYPSVPIIGRVTGEDIETPSGYHIPKGTGLIIEIYDMHRNPNLYENPEQFIPERFLSENCKNRHPFAYIPFSAGSRNCIGQRYALWELKAALCGILRAFKLEAVTKPRDLKFISDLVLRTEGPINVKFVKRSK